MAKTGSSNAYLHSKRNGLLNEALELMVGAWWAVEGGPGWEVPGGPRLGGGGDGGLVFSCKGTSTPSQSPSLNPEMDMFPNHPQVATPCTYLSHGIVTTTPKPALAQGPPAQKLACAMVTL